MVNVTKFIWFVISMKIMRKIIKLENKICSECKSRNILFDKKIKGGYICKDCGLIDEPGSIRIPCSQIMRD